MLVFLPTDVTVEVLEADEEMISDLDTADESERKKSSQCMEHSSGMASPKRRTSGSGNSCLYKAQAHSLASLVR